MQAFSLLLITLGLLAKRSLADSAPPIQCQQVLSGTEMAFVPSKGKQVQLAGFMPGYSLQHNIKKGSSGRSDEYQSGDQYYRGSGSGEVLTSGPKTKPAHFDFYNCKSAYMSTGDPVYGNGWVSYAGQIHVEGQCLERMFANDRAYLVKQPCATGDNSAISQQFFELFKNSQYGQSTVTWIDNTPYPNRAKRFLVPGTNNDPAINLNKDSSTYQRGPSFRAA